MRPLPLLKPFLDENDIFAISPGMFPRKTKQLDYLDILEDAERIDFTSPVKTSPTNLFVKSIKVPVDQQRRIEEANGVLREDAHAEINTEDSIADGMNTSNNKPC